MTMTQPPQLEPDQKPNELWIVFRSFLEGIVFGIVIGFVLKPGLAW